MQAIQQSGAGVWCLTLVLASVSPASGACPTVAGGYDHSLALASDGTVWAWGFNVAGELGDGTNTLSRLPLQVKDASGLGFLAGVSAVVGGWFHSLARASDGTVWAWGDNRSGALGDGTTTPSSLPVQVKDPSGLGFLAGISAISDCGSFHSLALASDGTVWAWGDNVHGQLGDGTTNPYSSLPVQVRDPAGIGSLSGVAAIAGGTSHSLALKADGTVWAWGHNPWGELGNGTRCPVPCDAHLPVQVRDPSGVGFLSGVAAIAGGEYFSMALKDDGTVWTWGFNFLGRLGDGSTTEYASLPVQVKDASGMGFLSGVSAISGGDLYSVALKSDGTVWTWGYNVYGQLGDGTNTTSNLPVQVKDPSDGSGFLSGVSAIAGGGYHALAVKSDGTVRTWGRNAEGQLGDGTGTFSSLPVQVKDALGTGVLGLGSFLPDLIPPDQGNVLRAVRRGSDAFLAFPLAPALAWRVYADGDRTRIGLTPLPPDATTPSFLDVDAVLRGSLIFYAVKGLSPCSSTPGP